MGTYAGNNANWIDDVYTFEETDPVQGGDTGIDNVPIKNLSDRTAWLKSQLGIINRFEDDVFISANASVGALLAGNFIVALSSGAGNVLTLTLEDAATIPHGAIFPISAFCEANHVVKILTTGGQKFLNPVDGDRSVMYMHNNEQLFLVALTDHFKVAVANGNFYSVGEEIKARKILNNTLPFLGQLVKRDWFPRLFKFVNEDLTIGQEVTTEATWFSHPLHYRGLFTLGTDGTNFRLPDERGMFERMLDLGRGVDYYRLAPYAGAFEMDAVKTHYHKTSISPNSNDQFGSGKVTTGGASNEGTIPPFQSTGPQDILGVDIGADENLVKNIGKYNLIKF